MLRTLARRLAPIICIISLAQPGIASDDLKRIPQGWSDDLRASFWFTSQGSQIVPYDWFLHLEDAGSTLPFRRPEHMESLRYVTLPMADNPTSLNPDGLPIGFVRNPGKKGKPDWLGLTCAACHTNVIEVPQAAPATGTTRYLIEGAPTLANFPRFFSELIAALQATDQDQQKFDRFAAAVIADGHSGTSANDLHQQLHAVAEALAVRQQVNTLPGTGPDYPGYARLDAFTNIMNQVVAIGLDDPTNHNLDNAPVSYPFLWGTPQSDVVQWNGAARNTDPLGPLARNVGEVVGVFGGVQIDPKHWWQFLKPLGYDSTIRMDNLGLLEGWLWRLRAPRWEDTSLPPLNPTLVAAGRAVYLGAGHCVACHELVEDGTRYAPKMIAASTVGTDANMAQNFVDNHAKTLRLEGFPKLVVAGKRFDAQARSFELVVNAVIGVILRDPLQAATGVFWSKGNIPVDLKSGADGQIDLKSLIDQANATLAGDALQRLVEQASGALLDERKDVAYKARPLNGIWATAPYLHNGSVPNLAELLKPSVERSPTFSVGSRTYDATNVGFSTAPVPDSTVFSSSDPGSKNDGHPYGTTLGDADKAALLEFLKSL